MKRQNGCAFGAWLTFSLVAAMLAGLCAPSSGAEKKTRPAGNLWAVCERTCSSPAEQADMLNRAKKEIEWGADPNETDGGGRNALYMAVKSNNVKIVEYLLDLGADPNVRAKDGTTASILAASLGRKDMIPLLKAKGGKVPDHPIPDSNTLCRAIEARDLAKVTALVAQGADVNGTWLGITPLHEAAVQGDLRIVTFLLDKGAKVDAKAERGHQAVQEAVQRRRLAIVDLLISKGCDVNAADNEGMTALHRAAGTSDNDDVISLLLVKGAKLDAGDKNGATALHCAAKSGDPYSVQLLISKGANLKAADKSGLTPLHVAAMTEWADVVRVLLKAGADTNSADRDGMTPLHLAAQKGARKVVQALLAGGANANARSARNETPLHFAAARARIDILKVLIKAGADLRATTKDGRLPVHVTQSEYVAKFLKEKSGATVTSPNVVDAPLSFLEAARKGDPVRLGEFAAAQPGLLEFTDDTGGTALHLAAAAGHRDCVGLLVLRGANVNATAKDGSTPLHAAAAGGHKDVVRDLFARKPDVNAKDKAGSTPLHLAAAGGHAEVVELLLAKGADAAVKDEKGRTALDVAKTPEVAAALKKTAGVTEPAPDAPTAQQVLKAAEGGDAAGLKRLLESAPKLLETRDDSGRTPLYVAASAGQAEAVAMLIGRGADVNAEQKTKSTPLHAVAARGYDSVAALLLEKKAGVNVQNDLGLTPLHYAAAYGREKVVELLLKSGADVAVKDKEGKTALDHARKQGRQSIIGLLEGQGKGNDGKAVP